MNTKVLSWNINHRTKERAMHPDILATIKDLLPDIVTLNEFVDGPSRLDFLSELKSRGYKNQLITAKLSIHNQILVAAKNNLELIPISGQVPQPQVASNLIFVRCEGLTLCSVRVPAFKVRSEKVLAWEFLVEELKVKKPDLVIGDLNVDADESPLIWSALKNIGLNRVPSERATYFGLRGTPRRLDHALARDGLIADLAVVDQVDGRRLVGHSATHASDHAAILASLSRF